MTPAAPTGEYLVEARLISEMANGNEAAFTAFYHRLAPNLYGMALRMMHDAKEAEDVLQEGFAYMWRKADRFDPVRGNALTWAVMIVRHRAIDQLRVRQRQEKVTERVIEETGGMEPIDDESCGKPALHERALLVRAAMKHVSPEQQQAMELAFFSGLTYDEIAKRLATPLSTVKARVRRGLVKMRGFLKEELA